MSQITKTAIENGYRYTCAGYYVEVTHNERFFTIYNINHNPAGTIIRPQVRARYWASYLLDGSPCTTDAHGVIAAFQAFIRKVYT